MSLVRGVVFAALAASLPACQQAPPDLGLAAALEASGKPSDAIAAYGAGCAKAPALCGRANARIAALHVSVALGAIDRGEWRVAAESLDAVEKSSSPGSKRAAAVLKDRVTSGLAFEGAVAGDKRSARKVVETIAEGDSPVAPKAREWLAREAPHLILEDMKVACQPAPPTATASCVGLAKQLDGLRPKGSPERTAAALLVGAEYQRMFPLLLQVEELLVEALAHFEHTWAFAMCRKRHEGCEAEIARVVPPRAQLQSRFERLVGDIRDPAVRGPLEARFADALERGNLVRKSWPKPENP